MPSHKPSKYTYIASNGRWRFGLVLISSHTDDADEQDQKKLKVHLCIFLLLWTISYLNIATKFGHLTIILPKLTSAGYLVFLNLIIEVRSVVR